MKKFLLALLSVTTLLTYAQNISDTKGELQVTGSGSASYTLPIALPPSIGNVAPQINISYTSGLSGGLAGQGWHLNSISNICRISDRLDIDGAVDGVDFDDNDKFALDGQRLILKSGSYAKDGSTYETEIKSNTKIELLYNNGVIYFITTAPDGSRTWYGSTGTGSANAVSANAWYVVRFEDTHGNYIVYNYDNISYSNTTQLYLNNIQFSGNVSAGIPLANSINFLYKTAARPERDFINGQSKYSSKLLEFVEVYTGGNLFRKYKLEYNLDTTFGYERLKKITEINGALEMASPVEFEYSNSSDGALIYAKYYLNNVNQYQVKLTGDFDGDGKLDYVTDGAIYKRLFTEGTADIVNLPFTANERTTLSATTLSSQKLNQFSSLINITENIASSDFKIYNLAGNMVGWEYSKTINIDNATFHDTSLNTYTEGSSNTPGTGASNCDSNTIKHSQKYFEGDFNGDGLSEIMIFNNKNERYGHQLTFIANSNGGTGASFCVTTYDVDEKEVYILDLAPAASTNLGDKGFGKLANASILDGVKTMVMDFNGDGKADILTFYANNDYSVCSIKQLPAAPWIELEVLGTGHLPNYAPDKQLLFGDYNGDGKLDIMTPEGLYSSNWYVHFASPSNTGGAFFTSEIIYNLAIYLPVEDEGAQFNHTINEYHAMDVNKDGKTDFVLIHKKSFEEGAIHYNSWNSEYKFYTWVNTMGFGQAPAFSPYFVSDMFTSGYGPMPQTVIANPKDLGLNQDMVMLWNDYRIHYISFLRNSKTDNLLKKVTEAQGKIVHTLDYKTMVAADNDLGNITDFYSSENSLLYPNVEIKKVPDSWLVSKLTVTVNGQSKYQDFKYRGLAVHVHGIGGVGFKRTARTGWYTKKDEQIWSVTQTDPLTRGSTTNTWTSRDEATVFAPIPSDLLSATTNTFVTHLFPSKVFNLLLTQQTAKDYLNDFTTVSKYQYEGAVSDPNAFGLQTSAHVEHFNGTTLEGLTVTETAAADYSNNPTGNGIDYHIGRPSRTTTRNEIYGSLPDTRTAEVKYTYNNRGDVTKTETKSQNSPYYLTEETTPDAVGNIVSKTVSAPGALQAVQPRTISSEYDTSKRFVLSKTDQQGFTTLLTYNDMGQVKTTKNHIDVLDTVEYDSWGKIKKKILTGTSNTALVTDYTYARMSDGGYTVTAQQTTGERSIIRYDVLGRVVKETTKGLASGSYISVETFYDALGRKSQVSEPSFGTATLFTNYTYDYLSRPLKIVLPTTKVVDYIYNGAETRTVDGGKTTAVTINSLGQKVSTADLGGNISFFYFANGALRKTEYGAHIIENTIDDWGNKTSVNDPNAGTYQYVTNPFGEMTKEITPKGSTTFTYSDTGRLTSKKIVGDGTNYDINYAYYSTGQLMSETNTLPGSIAEYSYTYDSLHRLSMSSERNTFFHHTNTTTYDNWGRVTIQSNYVKELLSNRIITVGQRYIYNGWCGKLSKITHTSNGTVYWEVNTANEKFQPLTESLNAGNVSINNTYTATGYATGQQHTINGADILKNTYEFDEVKGNLKKRNNLVFGLQEDFTYDNIDRLWTWTNPLTNLAETNIYDDQGRISSSSEIGDVSYNSDPLTGIYRKESIKLNTTGMSYYNALNTNRTVSYTMFKAPISIAEGNVSKVEFSYNGHLSRSKMVYDYGTVPNTTTKDFRKSKLYTDDGTTEVLYETENNINYVRFRIYIGGDAYTAPLYHERKLNRSTGAIVSDFKYYIHRDYLGSVLAVTSEAGAVMEQRHFDAWGKLTQIKVSGVTANPENGLQFYDRGYTSHEHLKDVGLIHMNGRLYDPMLKSFMMPDNFVQDPDNSQNYNRYSYVMNNPLRYTDVSGEFWGELAVSAAIAVAVSVAAYIVTNYVGDQPITLKGTLRTSAFAAISAAATFGVGSMCATIGNFFIRASVEAVANGVVQGTFSAVQGQNFWSGFASGALSSIAMSAWRGGNTDVFHEVTNRTWTTTHSGISGALGLGNSTAAMIAFGSVVGGAGAELAGGNFWQGAASGLMVGSLNHAMHEIDPPKKRTQESDKAEGWTSSQMRDLYEFNKLALDGAMLLDGAAELSAVNWTRLMTSFKGLISFGSKNIIPEGKGANHLFKSVRDGLKLSDNPANRELITRISNGKSLGVDKYGKSWYQHNFYGPKGNVMQIYTYTKDGIIKGAGVNNSVIDLVKRYGLQ